MSRLLIIIFFVTTQTFGQTHLPKKVADYISSLNLQPLARIDTFSKQIPKNFVTGTGWHVDYYARITANDGPAQLDVHELIYNDSIFCSSWRPFNTRQKIEYDFIELKYETPEYLYFGLENTALDTFMYMVSKSKDHLSFQFSDLLFKDLTAGIFIEYSAENCVESEMPLVLDIINTRKVKYDRIKFKGYCTDIKSCLKNINYSNGMVTITATLIKKRTKKQFTETKIYKT